MTISDRIRNEIKTNGVPSNFRGFAAEHHEEYGTTLGSLRKQVARISREFDSGNYGIEEAAESHGVDLGDLKHVWMKNDNSSAYVVNPDFGMGGFKVEDVDWSLLIDACSKVTPPEKAILKPQEGLFDRLVYTDVHIGLEPNADGFSLYGGKWDEESVMNTCTSIIKHVSKEQNSTTLIIDELGDFLDGWDAQTARKGHTLEQNMDNQKMFDVGLKFKILMINELYKIYDNIIVNNICVDNHAAAFGYVVNSAFKTYCDNVLKNVDVTNHRRFINHYNIANYCFIISHGKDDKNLKFGFKKEIDDKAEKKINNYIDEHYLYQPNIKIEFSKGDTHQMMFDDTTAERFHYYSYPSLAPASNWVQTNFQKGKRGCFFFNYFENRSYIKPLYFNDKNN